MAQKKFIELLSFTVVFALVYGEASFSQEDDRQYDNEEVPFSFFAKYRFRTIAHGYGSTF